MVIRCFYSQLAAARPPARDLRPVIPHSATPPCGRGIMRPKIPRGHTHSMQAARGTARSPFRGPAWGPRGALLAPFCERFV
jgi:hypothetical protein